MKGASLIRSGSSQLLIGSGSHSLRRSRTMSILLRSPIHILVKMSRKELATSVPDSLRRVVSDTALDVTDRSQCVRSPPVKIPEKVEFVGGGRGKGTKVRGCGSGGGDQNENKRMENYYQEMLRSNPSNPLLLRNYGRFLHEVEGDSRGAEECYGRAILSNPNEGEVLLLYGKLVWENHRDKERAGDYFQRAVEASPDDCYVLGSYASFLWDAEEEEKEEENAKMVV